MRRPETGRAAPCPQVTKKIYVYNSQPDCREMPDEIAKFMAKLGGKINIVINHMDYVLMLIMLGKPKMNLEDESILQQGKKMKK